MAPSTPATRPKPLRSDSTRSTTTPVWLQFQVFSDGQDAGRAAELRTHDAFPQFASLPPELRLKIWSYLLTPRVLLCACLHTPGPSPDPPSSHPQLASRPRCPRTPALLHVNRETRALALRRYAPAFAWSTRPLDDPGGEGEGEEEEGGEGWGWGEGQVGRPARQWFDFARDALLLLGELQPGVGVGAGAGAGADGACTSAVRLLSRADLARVRHVAVAFEALGYGFGGPQQQPHVFGALSLVVDRCRAARRLLVSCTERDERAYDAGPGVLPTGENVIQKIWCAWVNGTTSVASRLADRQVLMVREEDLETFIGECG